MVTDKPQPGTVGHQYLQLALLDHGLYSARKRTAAARDVKPKQPRGRAVTDYRVASSRRFGATRQEIADAIDLTIQSVCGLVPTPQTMGRIRETDPTRLRSNGNPAALESVIVDKKGGHYGA